MAQQYQDRDAVINWQDHSAVPVTLWVDHQGNFIGGIPPDDTTGTIIIRTVHELRSA